jgi:hypothetical protein
MSGELHAPVALTSGKNPLSRFVNIHSSTMSGNVIVRPLCVAVVTGCCRSVIAVDPAVGPGHADTIIM